MYICSPYMYVDRLSIELASSSISNIDPIYLGNKKLSDNIKNDRNESTSKSIGGERKGKLAEFCRGRDEKIFYEIG